MGMIRNRNRVGAESHDGLEHGSGRVTESAGFIDLGMALNLRFDSESIYILCQWKR